MFDNQNFEEYAKLKKFNTNIAKSWEDIFFGELKKRKLTMENIFFLDYGCGDGKYYNYLLQKGASKEKVYGMEVSKTRVKRCHDIGWNNCLFLELMKPLPYEDNTFDVINMIEVIEHIPKSEISFYLNEFKRILKPNGFFLCTTPNYPIKRFYDICDSFILRQNRFKDDPTHVSFYNPKKLSNLLRKHFKNITINVYKEGGLYRKFKKQIFMHKMLLIGDNNI